MLSLVELIVLLVFSSLVYVVGLLTGQFEQERDDEEVVAAVLREVARRDCCVKGVK